VGLTLADIYMQLAYQRTGTPGTQPLLILHGFLGMADNWRTQALRLAERYDVWAIDLRNHGRSPHSDVFDYASMAADVAELCSANNLTNIVLLGHSMGGKVAMEYARHNHANLHQLVIVDISPKAYPPHHTDVLAALNAVHLSTLQTRADAETAMSQHLPDNNMLQFLLKSLAGGNVRIREHHSRYCAVCATHCNAHVVDPRWR
jgi:esterase